MKLRADSSGIHLFDRTTGVNVLLNAHPPREVWARAPRYVSIALLNACDLRCPYCYAPKHRARVDEHALMGWLVELDRNGCLGVGFGGGEPTLYPGFGRVCRRIASATALAVTLTTHGHRFDPKLACELRGSVHFIRVSMDGVGLTYQSNRGRSFEALLRALDAIRSVCPFGLNIVVNAQTVRELDAVAEVARATGASQLLLLPERPARGRNGIDAATQRDLTSWVAKYTGPLNLAISDGNHMGLVIADPFPGEPMGTTRAHIDADGVVKASSYSSSGIRIDDRGVLAAIDDLKQMEAA